VVVLSYALALPGSIHLNRGNHEDRLFSQSYSFRKQLDEKYGVDAADIFADCVGVFQALPLAAVLREPGLEPEGGIAVLHSGLPRKNGAHRLLADVASIDRSAEGLDTVCGVVVDGSERAAVSDIVWGEPDWSSDAAGSVTNTGRCQGVVYSQAYAHEWLEAAGLHTLIRSHQVVPGGAEQIWPIGPSGKHSIWTVFSASNFPNHTGSSDGAVLKYTAADGLREPEIIRYRTDEPGQFHRTSATGARLRFDFATSFMVALLGVLRLICQHKWTHSVEKTQNTPGRTVASLGQLVHSHRYRLRQAFEQAALAEGAKPNRISASGWGASMRTVLQMENVNWVALQPHVAPNMQRRVHDSETGESTTVPTDEINFVKFLQDIKMQQPELTPVVLPGPKSCATGPPGIMVLRAIRTTDGWSSGTFRLSNFEIPKKNVNIALKSVWFSHENGGIIWPIVGLDVLPLGVEPCADGGDVPRVGYE
jgi:hypothetical protein